MCWLVAMFCRLVSRGAAIVQADREIGRKQYY
jgi:hypothetical protein